MGEAGTGLPSRFPEFIILGGNPSQAVDDDRVRKLVRSNASRYVQQRYTAQNSANQSIEKFTESVHDFRTAKSRFALSSRTLSKRVRRRAKPQTAEVPPLEPQSSALHHTHAQSRPSDIGASNACNSLAEIPKSIDLQSSYSSAWLPRDDKPMVETMTQHFFSQVTEAVNDPAGIKLHDLDSLAKKDQAIFHSCLSIASVYYDTGACDLFHCQQALSLVSRRLNSHAHQSSDETIGAVALLVLHNILTGTVEHSNLHMNGLEQMICARGGLGRLPIRLQKTLSMIDLYAAIIWNGRPRFPFILSQDLAGTFRGLQTLSKSDKSLLKSLVKSYSQLGMYELLRILRILTAIILSDRLALSSRLLLTDAMYLLEHRLLSLREHSRSDGGLHEAFSLAVCMYINKVLREMPPINTQGLARRLIVAIETTLSSGDADLPEHLNLAIILWILVISRILTQESESSQYLIRKLIPVCEALGIRHDDSFRECLEGTGPTLQAFDGQCREVWAEIEEFRNRAS